MTPGPESIPSTFKAQAESPQVNLAERSPQDLAAGLFGATRKHLFAEPSYETGNVEGFLAQTAELFAIVDESWTEVKRDTDKIHELIAGGLYPDSDPIKNVVVWKRPDADSDRKLRKDIEGESKRLGLGAILVEENREKARHYKDRLCDASAGSDKVLDEYWTKQLLEAVAKPPGHNDPQMAKTVLPEDIDEAATQIYESYARAFSSQQLAIHYIEKLLQADANVMPFVERLKEIAALRRAGINEFPGLLETVNICITDQKQNAPSALEQAITRVAPGTHRLETFVERILLDDDPSVEGQINRAFLAGIEGARFIAKAVSFELSEQGVDKAIVIGAVTKYLAKTKHQTDWQEAYQEDTRARAEISWRQLLDHIRQYNRRGRASNDTPIRREDVERVAQSGSKRRRERAIVDGALSQSQTEEVVTAHEEKTPPVLAIMKNIGGGGRRFGFETFDSLEEISEQDIITKFVARYPGNTNLSETVKAYLGQLSGNPVDRLTTKTLEQSFALVGEGTRRDMRYPLRRFRPRSSGEGDALHKRVRILYGLAAVSGRNLLLLNTVTLRERDTYGQ
jgi:hypothetical protein